MNGGDIAGAPDLVRLHVDWFVFVFFSWSVLQMIYRNPEARKDTKTH